MSQVKFYCEICREYIGKIEPDTIQLPLTPDQFKPIYIHPVLVYLFPPELTWEWFRCPVCGKRPFIEPIRLLTENGYINPKPEVIVAVEPVPECLNEPVEEAEPVEEPIEVVSKPQEIVYEPCGYESILNEATKELFGCQICGKICNSKIGYISHMRHAHKKKAFHNGERY
jgi:uncharacterized C2H2 Zn-finger protein